MKEASGYIYQDGKKWVARVTYTDSSGKRRNVKKYCLTKTEANRTRDRLVRELHDKGKRGFEDAKMRFTELADKYREAKIIEPVYVGERKVAGMRSRYSANLHLNVLVAHFGNKRIRDITHAEIEAFKLRRLQTPKRGGQQRTVTAVNRELEMMRTVMAFAIRQGLIAVSPFKQGEQLIDRTAEVSRSRVLSFDEEARLLATCIDRRAHLRPLIIAAVDTGLRRGELLKLEWSDIDFAQRIIRVRAINAKTNQAREVAMTGRLFAELKKLEAEPLGDLVFGIHDHFRRSFATACKEAEISDLHFHDLRHTCVTRMIEAGLQHTEAMKVSGHATLDMLNRYLNVNLDTSRRAADALDVLRANRTEQASNNYVN